MTQPLGINYGGVVQNWALQQVLIRMGHEPLTIGLRWLYREGIKQRIKQWVVKGRNVALNGLLFNSVLKQRIDKRVELNLVDFVNRHIKITRIYDPPLLPHQLDEYGLDAIVVGSDQVWKPSYSPDIMNFYLDFLSGNPDIVKLSYAASFGSSLDEYPSELIRNCAALLEKFDGISVREHSAIQVCKDHFGSDAECVLDPTLLLDAQDYIDLANAEHPESLGKNYGICYFLNPDEDKLKKFVSSCRDRGVMPVSLIPLENTYNLDLLVPTLYPSVQRWLKGIMEASYVMTDSFHGMVFSLIFERSFSAFNNSVRGSDRFTSMLTLFGNHFGHQCDVIDDSHFDANFPDKLAALKRKSVDFLSSHLVSRKSSSS